MNKSPLTTAKRVYYNSVSVQFWRKITFNIEKEGPTVADYTKEISKRRTFAIISHPDAGKTTLTEKFLLYGGAINLAGSVKGKATARHAVSDWMEIEKERGISVTSSVLQFNYDGYCINILDTPGHQDFLRGYLPYAYGGGLCGNGHRCFQRCGGSDQKLFKVCAMRHIPIFTFINKMDRDANDTFDLLDDIEKELGIQPALLTGLSDPERNSGGSMTGKPERY